MEKKAILKGETPPPLPARNPSLRQNDLGLAYLAVDVTDWKKIEENCTMYAEEKDDWRVSLLPERKTISKSETPLPLPGRNQSLPHNDQELAYLAVDVTDWKKIEGMMYAEVKDDGRVFKPGDAENVFLGVPFKPDETEDYQLVKDPRPEGECNKGTA